MCRRELPASVPVIRSTSRSPAWFRDAYDRRVPRRSASTATSNSGISALTTEDLMALTLDPFMGSGSALPGSWAPDEISRVSTLLGVG